MGLAKENSNTEWTEERKQELKELYNKGLSDIEIALKTGRSRAAIAVQRNKMDLPKVGVEKVFTHKEITRRVDRLKIQEKGKHIREEDVISFELEEGKRYILKNVATNRLTQVNGYLTNKKAKGRVIKNYREYIAFEINKRCECIQKIDLISGNVEYEEV